MVVNNVNAHSSFDQYCELTRQYDPEPSPKVLPDNTTVPVYSGPGVDTFVAKFGRADLLDYSEFLKACIFLKGLHSNFIHSEQVLGQPGPT